MPTGINYLDETWNPITGCSGKGCKAQCWAEDMISRFFHIHGCTGGPDPDPLPFNKINFHPDRLNKPLHWKKPRRIGVCFMGDIADEQVEYGWVHQIWDTMKKCPQHTFFTLTKQPTRLADMVGLIYRKEAMGAAMGFWSHVYNGVSITGQDDEWMIPEIWQIPGKHWFSLEPLLGEINLERITLGEHYFNSLTGHFSDDPEDWNSDKPVDWVVIGCESGPKCRPCPQEWVEAIVEQCKAVSVPVWVKQLDICGKVVHDVNKFPEHLRIREYPK